MKIVLNYKTISDVLYSMKLLEDCMFDTISLVEKFNNDIIKNGRSINLIVFDNLIEFEKDIEELNEFLSSFLQLLIEVDSTFIVDQNNEIEIEIDHLNDICKRSNRILQNTEYLQNTELLIGEESEEIIKSLLDFEVFTSNKIKSLKEKKLLIDVMRASINELSKEKML